VNQLKKSWKNYFGGVISSYSSAAGTCSYHYYVALSTTSTKL